MLPRRIGRVELDVAQKVAEEFQGERRKWEESDAGIALENAVAEHRHSRDVAKEVIEAGEPNEDHDLSGLLPQKTVCLEIEEEEAEEALGEEEKAGEEDEKELLAEQAATGTTLAAMVAGNASPGAITEPPGHQRGEQCWQCTNFQHAFHGCIRAHALRVGKRCFEAPVCGGA